MRDCVAACTDLGLSLEDVEKAMQRYIRREERRRSGVPDGVISFRGPAAARKGETSSHA